MQKYSSLTYLPKNGHFSSIKLCVLVIYKPKNPIGGPRKINSLKVSLVFTLHHKWLCKGLKRLVKNNPQPHFMCF